MAPQRGDSQLSGNSLIRLYAGGSSGTINSTGNTTLNGTAAKTIAANTVNIFNNVQVTINGNLPANVYTNNPNYTGFGGNGSTTGTFTGMGATTKSLSALPPAVNPWNHPKRTRSRASRCRSPPAN